MKKTEKPSETPLEAPKSTKTPEPSLDGSTLLSDLQRTRADFENYRKNVEKEKENFGKLIKFSTVEKVLPLLDDLDRAISAYPKELKPLEKNFAKALKNLELEKIETAPGTEFNPELHEAVLVEPSDGEKEVIKETLRPGYFYQGEILRPAMVKVEHV